MMYNVANTNKSIAFGGNTGAEPTGKVWEVAKRNNEKPITVRIRQVESYKRVGVL